jgi:hypothetical protein
VPFLFNFDQATAADILGAMITPAVLISASGTLTLSTTNRLGRVVDRVRELQEVAEGMTPDAADPEAAEKRALISDQLGWLTLRIRLLQTAVTSLYVAIGLLVSTSIAIGLSASSGWRLMWVPVALGLCGASSLFVGAVLLVREARMAVRSTLVEVEYVKRVIARRTGLADLPAADEDLAGLLPGRRLLRKLLNNDPGPPPTG